MIIRSEIPADGMFIRSLTDAAFMETGRSCQTEGAIIGHVAFSPVLIDGQSRGWFGLGPVSVSPFRQGGGVASH